MSVWIWTLSSVLTVSLASFVGLVFLSRGAEHLDSVLMYLVSLAAGVLLGGAFFHLIPEAYEIHGGSVALPLWVLTGFLGFFFLERFLWAHHHGHGQAPVTGREPAHSGPEHGSPPPDRGPGRRHDPADDHDPVRGRGHGPPAPRLSGDAEGGGVGGFRPVVVMSLVGDGLHNFIDGMIIAAAFGAGTPLGLVTAGAVLLHEVPQEAGEFGILVQGGLAPRRALLLNFLSASMALVGAGLVLVLGLASTVFTHALIPITAGNFIYIAAADLIPELHHEHDPVESWWHAALLVAGVLLMFVLRATTHGAVH